MAPQIVHHFRQSAYIATHTKGTYAVESGDLTRRLLHRNNSTAFAMIWLALLTKCNLPAKNCTALNTVLYEYKQPLHLLVMARSHWPECHFVCFPNRNLGVRGANGSYSGSIRCVLGAYWLFGSVRMHTEPIR